MSMPTRIHGRGIEIRHSRSCLIRSGSACSCESTFRAWVFNSAKGKKYRKSFRSRSEAQVWRLFQLRKLYGLTAPQKGKLDEGYALLRKSLQEIDRSRPDVPRSVVPLVREAIDAMYEAEDALLEALRLIG